MAGKQAEQANCCSGPLPAVPMAGYLQGNPLLSRVPRKPWDTLGELVFMVFSGAFAWLAYFCIAGRENGSFERYSFFGYGGRKKAEDLTKMGRLYLHIGTPKTGTSMIQFFMAKNQGILLRKGYTYPDFEFTFEGIGQNRNAHFLTHEYYDDDKNRLYDEEKKLQEQGFSRLLDELRQNENVVMSDEHIWTGYRVMENFWENLVKRVTEAGHELKVIVYLRRQDAYIQSYWAQLVKETSKESFSAYIKKKHYYKSRMDYNTELDVIANIVGRENLIVRIYEKGQYYGGNGSLVEDFLHVIGLEMTEEYKGSERIVNGSISGDCLEVKRILNRMPEFRARKNFLIPVMQKVTSREGKSSDYFRAACFAEGQRKEFLEQFREGNEAVARKYLNKDSGVLFEEEAPENETVKAYTKEELVLACGELLLEMEELVQKITEREMRIKQSRSYRLLKKGKSVVKKIIRR